MKRSHVLKEINLFLYECKKDGFNSKESAESLLDFLEILGMRPPDLRVVFKLKLPDGTYKPCNSVVNKWEPEDD
jgi:hypothetical protein